VVAPAERVRGVGIDLEHDRALDDDLIDLVCTPAERSWAAARTRQDGGPWSKLVFSAKEALFKCLFPTGGRFLEFHDAELRLEPDAGAFTVVRASGYYAAAVRGRFEVGGGFIASAVVLAP
jgi:4'-phosphopantetheinyl transferase EntD